MSYHSGAATYIMPSPSYTTESHVHLLLVFIFSLGDALFNLQASPNRFMLEPFIGGFPIDGSYQERHFGLSRLSHLRHK